MEVVEAEQLADPPLEDFVPVSHFSPNDDPQSAFCGARLLGVDAWPPYRECPVCLAIAALRGLLE